MDYSSLSQIMAFTIVCSFFAHFHSNPPFENLRLWPMEQETYRLFDAPKTYFSDFLGGVMNFYSEAAVETGPMEAQLVTLGLRHEEKLTSAEVLKAYKKKILLHASGKGGGKIENYTNAYVQVIFLVVVLDLLYLFRFLFSRL